MNNNPINRFQEINGETFPREYKAAKKSVHKRFKIIYFFSIGFVVLIVMTVTILNLLAIGNDPGLDLKVLLSFFITVIILAPPLILGYNHVLKLHERVGDNFTIILDKDSIAVNICGSIYNTIYRNEIDEVVEGRFRLKVRSKGPKRKTIQISKKIEGYEELKRELQRWVNEI